MSKRAPWTDEELGALADSDHLPLKDLAASLGRSKESVRGARNKVRRGWTRRQSPWTGEEIEVINSSPSISNADLAQILPGRTVEAVAGQRKSMRLKAPTRNEISPFVIAARTVIAKTCTKCGLLLPGEKFPKQGKKTQSHCRYCKNADSVAWGSANPDKRKEARSRREEQEKAATKRWAAKMQELTLKTATRQGYPYLESDFEVLKDPTLSVLGKALRLERTWSGVYSACSTRGLRSKGLVRASRSESAWSIDNPNADRIEEITAALKQEFTDAGIQFPEWDWDDEDLKETAA